MYDMSKEALNVKYYNYEIEIENGMFVRIHHRATTFHDEVTDCTWLLVQACYVVDLNELNRDDVDLSTLDIAELTKSHPDIVTRILDDAGMWQYDTVNCSVELNDAVPDSVKSYCDIFKSGLTSIYGAFKNQTLTFNDDIDVTFIMRNIEKGLMRTTYVQKLGYLKNMIFELAQKIPDTKKIYNDLAAIVIEDNIPEHVETLNSVKHYLGLIAESFRKMIGAREKEVEQILEIVNRGLSDKHS
jgi:hypothetical protein